MVVKGILIHCSDSPQGRGDEAKDIHAWHVERGFDGIGYHFVITEEGTIQSARPLYWNGAHARGYNSSHIGICLIGKGLYSEEQYMSLKHLLELIKEQYPIIRNENILGHYQVDAGKTCPMFDVPKFKEDNGLA